MSTRASGPVPEAEGAVVREAGEVVEAAVPPPRAEAEAEAAEAGREVVAEAEVAG
ncbi:hypothetical protein [Streptomyces pakalii]|uniref:Uncharacterized protein n=1 Tax=Streptomyces pakalii TaxID=3036494 RepID=A0ABT7D4A3_9ACTN|nr:hypothetical protein [Streptomyces pakalii]MDJ1640627.1 hypothetical protein [Streptomyces pakalii]